MFVKRSFVVLIACVFFVGACVTKTETRPAEGTGKETTVRSDREDATGSVAGDASSSSMDRLEMELRQTLAGAENIWLKRRRNILVVTLNSDTMFGFDSASIKSGARSEISRVAEVLERYPKTRIRIEGHTDSIGDAGYNQELSERRADAVRKELISLGMQSERSEVVGFGAVRPVASNKTPDGRRQNRRIKLVIMSVRERL